VACILQHVPLLERFTSCALVCRAWAAAAAAVPSAVCLPPKDSDHLVQLQDWLALRGGAVVALTLQPLPHTYQHKWSTLQLPVLKLVRLRSLNLCYINAQVSWLDALQISNGGMMPAALGLPLRNADSSIGSTAAILPQLQELRLSHCNLTKQLVDKLLTATTLTKLQWEFVYLHNDTLTRMLAEVEVLAILWQRLQLLPKLSELQLGGESMTAADVTPLSALQRLQHFTLQLDCSTYSEKCMSGARELLSALQHLTQLQHLQLERCQLHTVQPEHQTADTYDTYECFSALTASTQLTHLEITEWGAMPVPIAAFDYMFPPGWVLPNLKVLVLDGFECGSQRCVCGQHRLA
jgi:hypothetical protein